ncbi:DUF2867 domain-containing protein [Actinokineospora bangkokensis]|uniref:NAD(P)-binding domain-containing protein n=1 Tax=Actinokineospora bangkokensis TaxID=1193682 RepID=A0A1Q9LH36_9PSEU|nr:DUF2867 domain-containing protein [Actinokineospora bangkokensis]OLR91325.1 hypothetical protein BJP25_27045 [Actinokineospora bangkokensis]
MSTAVAGASGYVGHRLVASLDADGEEVIALGRHPDSLPDGDHVRHCAVDVGDTQALTEVLDGVTTAYYLVHAMAGGEGFAEKDRQLARSFADAAVAAGVQRIVYLGGLGAEGLSEHLESRQEVGRLLAETGVPVVELRAAVIIGSGSISFEMMRYLTERLPFMVCPRWVQTKVQPIAESDLIACLRQSADPDRVPAGVYEIGGPDVLTYEDLMHLYARVRDLPRRRIVRVPLLTPQLSSYWVHVVTPVDRAVSSSLVDSLRNDVVVTQEDNPFDLECVPMAEAIARTLDDQRDRTATAVFEADNGVVDGIFTLSTSVPMQPHEAKGARLDLSQCGNDLHWYGWAWAWVLRIWLGKLFGEKLELHRPPKVEKGAVVDWWTVADMSDHHIVLYTNKWFCGEAWLGYRIDVGGQPRLRQVGALRAKGLLGWAYWRAVYPVHLVVFRVMARKQTRRAHALARKAARSAEAA